MFKTKEPDSSISILDFGSANVFHVNQALSKFHGTPFYMAPEVIHGDHNEKSDVWSTGIIFYMMLCGYPPFYGEEDWEIFESALNDPLEFPEEEWAGIDPLAQDLIQKMLDRDPLTRLSMK
jgi:calcium-dependent protein kinase